MEVPLDEPIALLVVCSAEVICSPGGGKKIHAAAPIGKIRAGVEGIGGADG